MTINSSPVLTGESARAFVEEAERYGKLPTLCLTTEREARIAEFLAYNPKTLRFYEKNGFKPLVRLNRKHALSLN